MIQGAKYETWLEREGTEVNSVLKNEETKHVVSITNYMMHRLELSVKCKSSVGTLVFEKDSKESREWEAEMEMPAASRREEEQPVDAIVKHNSKSVPGKEHILIDIDCGILDTDTQRVRGYGKTSFSHAVALQ